MTRPAVVVWSPRYGVDIGAHVFPTAKYERVIESLRVSGQLAECDLVEPTMPTRAELERAHDAGYLEELESLRWTPRTQYSELPLTRELVESNELAAGGTLLAARLAMRHGAAAHVGGGLHHAYRDHAEGFCYINDLAVAAAVLLAERVVQRVAVVDLDVHQGNGTAGIFAGDDRVFTLSVHQEANYPVPKEVGDLDIGLVDGTGDDAYLAALAPALARVWDTAPQLVLYQAGADPFLDDQLGGLRLSLDGLEARDRAVFEGCAGRRIPVVSTLGGGYARRLEDTVHIHATTTRLAMAVAR